MPEFLELLQPEAALKLILDAIQPSQKSEWINTSESLGRITFRAVRAQQPLPAFVRSTVDGYALRSRDTYGASEAFPGYLSLIGEVRMGTQADFTLQPGECTLIHTGGMLPQEADAVIMVEYTQRISEDEIEITRPVANGENLIYPGEDIKEGEIVIPASTRIRPQEIGGLMALGVTKIEVTKQLKVGIISSGDEIVSPLELVKPGQVRDINTYTLQALISSEQAVPISYGILPDNMIKLKESAKDALQDCDMLVFTAGSSASARDLTAEVINSLGKPGVLVHGVNIRPGKPTILAACQQEGGQPVKPVIGLPGNPVSALVIARLFVVPIMQKVMGLYIKPYQPTLSARLMVNLPSQAGREDWVPTRLFQTQEGLTAEPIFGKSNLIFSLSKADGLIRIPPDANGISAGSEVQVVLI